MKKIVLGDKQAETLEECVNLAINFLQGVDEYKADFKRYSDLRDKLVRELSK